MIVPQWVIGCGHITFLLFKLLGRWLGSTILIRLMYAKTRLVSQAYQWHTCWTNPWKKSKSLSYIHQEAFANYVGIYEKNSSTVVVMVPWNVMVIRMSVRYAGPRKVWVWNDSCLWVVKDRHGGWASASFYEKYITHIRSHVYGEKSKLTKGVIDYDANNLYLYCSGDIMPCGKDELAVW